MKRRSVLVGGICFLLGATMAALAATAIRPEQFVALPWTWSAAQTFGDGDLVLSGASSGSATLKAPATGGGTATLPAGSGTLVYTSGSGSVTSVTCGTGLTGGTFTTTGTCALDVAHANTWTAVQAFTDGDLSLLGSSSGNSVVHAPASGGGAITLPAGAATLAALGVAQTWTALQQFTDGDFALKGSSSGTTTLKAAAAAGSTTITFPAATDTVAVLGTADQVVAGGANVTSQSQSTGNITVDCGSRPLQYITNGGAYTITAPSNDGSCILLSTNNGSAGAITFSGFSVGSNIGDTLDTTNAHKFSIFVWRVNSVSGYRVAAHQ